MTLTADELQLVAQGVGELRCGVCGESKPLDAFALDKSSRRGRTSYCKTCRAEWARRYRAANPDLDRENHLLTRYGITSEQYDAMLTAQNGRCALCESDEPRGNGNRFHVDHDHETGKVRGLLCSPCNTGIARFRDDPALLRAAADYVEAHRVDR